MRKKAVVYIAIFFEVLCIVHLFPRKGVPEQDLIGGELSKICLNAPDLFQAYVRADYLIEKYDFYSAVLNVMFYADIKSKENKEYIVYFEPLPEQRESFTLLNPEGGIKIYVKDLSAFVRYRKTVNDLEEIYDDADSCYDIGRSGYRP